MPKIDTIVRFHDIARLNELDRCLFSLYGQTHRPINVIVALQDLNDEEFQAVVCRLSWIDSTDDEFTVEYVNYRSAYKRDARSLLITKSLSACSGRFVGFLDYDDTLYPEAYSLLTEKIVTSKAAIVFSSVRRLKVDIWPNFQYATSILPQFSGSNLGDLFTGNFCPIHSYLIDRNAVNTEDLYFDNFLSMEEDYEFLLRLVCQYKSDFSLVGTEIGDYYHKSDGSNSHAAIEARDEKWWDRYSRVSSFIDARRDILKISPNVLNDVVFSGASEILTVGDFVRWKKLKEKAAS